MAVASLTVALLQSRWRMPPFTPDRTAKKMQFQAVLELPQLGMVLFLYRNGSLHGEMVLQIDGEHVVLGSL